MKINPIVRAVLTAYLMTMMAATFVGMAVLPFIVWLTFGLSFQFGIACIPVIVVTLFAIIVEQI